MDVLKLLAGNILRFNEKHTVTLAMDLLDSLTAPRPDDEKPGAIAAAASQWLVGESEKIFKGNSAG